MKASHITLSEAAVADVLEQAAWYEAQVDRQLAERWDRAVTSTMLRISKWPKSGSPCNFKTTELRGTRRVPVAGFPRHLVFYRLQGDEVFVLRIVHGARDLESLLTT